MAQKSIDIEMLVAPRVTRTMSVAELPAALRVSEAAVVLDVAESSVRMLIKQGTLDAVRVGRLVRIKRDSLQRFLGHGAAVA